MVITGLGLMAALPVQASARCAATQPAHSDPSLAACSIPWACQSPKLTPEPWIFQSLRPFAVRPTTTAAAALGLANTWSRANRIALPSWPGTIAPSRASFSRKTLYACSTPVQAAGRRNLRVR